MYFSTYNSSLAEILLISDEVNLVGLYFLNQRFYPSKLLPSLIDKETPPIAIAKNWLNIYFSGDIPDFLPPYKLTGTPFQKSVWKILSDIPYGKTTTYGNISKIIANKKGILKMSSQAIGSAIGRNPISIIIPCHRVIGANGNLGGYAGGLNLKIKLLTLENPDFNGR